MTNEEKAQDLSEKAIDYIPCNSTLPFYLNALKMAEWKDKEFEYIINIALEMIGEQNGSCSEDVFEYKQKIKELLKDSNNQY